MNKATDTTLTIIADFRRFVEELKARVIGARTSAARAVTHDAILLYWDIGRGIVEKQKTHGWGDSVVELVAADLRRAFPEMSGFSPRNVWDMRRFYATYSAPEIHSRAVREIEHGQSKPILRQVVAESAASKKQSVIKADESVDEELLRQLVAEIPWGQNLLILNKLTNPAARLYYLRATARFGWSRNVLLNQIKASAYERAVTEKKTHNFELALPEHFAEQADEMLKSSYSLDFLGLHRAVKARELEDRLISRLQSFLLELVHRFIKTLTNEIHGFLRQARRTIAAVLKYGKVGQRSMAEKYAISCQGFNETMYDAMASAS